MTQVEEEPEESVNYNVDTSDYESESEESEESDADQPSYQVTGLKIPLHISRKRIRVFFTGNRIVPNPVKDEESEEGPLHLIDSEKLPYLVSDVALSANIDPDLEKLRLEDIDISTMEGYPKLGEGAGNYESNPPMPKIGDEGHTGPGEGGKSPVKLDSEEELKGRFDTF